MISKLNKPQQVKERIDTDVSIPIQDYPRYLLRIEQILYSVQSNHYHHQNQLNLEALDHQVATCVHRIHKMFLINLAF